jgi:hypothetical protein
MPGFDRRAQAGSIVQSIRTQATLLPRYMRSIHCLKKKGKSRRIKRSEKGEAVSAPHPPRFYWREGVSRVSGNERQTAYFLRLACVCDWSCFLLSLFAPSLGSVLTASSRVCLKKGLKQSFSRVGASIAMDPQRPGQENNGPVSRHISHPPHGTRGIKSIRPQTYLLACLSFPPQSSSSPILMPQR